MSLDLYLNKLASQGASQSQGFFTLDQAEAIRKLREYQVAEPWEFVAALVASAVASGAEWVRIESRLGYFRLEHNGSTVSHDRLVTVFSTLLVGTPDREFSVVRELAYGLNALSALRPSRIRVTCSDPEELVLLEMSPEKLQVIRAEPYETYSEKRLTTVEVQKPRGGLTAGLLRTVGRAPELEVLKKRCPFCSVPIYWNERKIEYPKPLPYPFCVLKVGSPAKPETLDWPEPWISVEGDCNAYVGISKASESRLLVLIHGLCFRVPEPGLPIGVSALVCGELFKKDLSHSGIVKDNAFETAHSSLLTSCHDFLLSIAENQSGRPPELLAQVALSLKSEALLARQRWETDTAQRLSDGANKLSAYL